MGGDACSLPGHLDGLRGDAKLEHLAHIDITERVVAAIGCLDRADVEAAIKCQS